MDMCLNEYTFLGVHAKLHAVCICVLCATTCVPTDYGSISELCSQLQTHVSLPYLALLSSCPTATYLYIHISVNLSTLLIQLRFPIVYLSMQSSTCLNTISVCLSAYLCLFIYLFSVSTALHVCLFLLSVSFLPSIDGTVNPVS